MSGPVKVPGPGQATDESHRYWAFISYSHQDTAWARWLHRELESYRVPKRLVGDRGGRFPVPRRLFPIFRDRDELSSSAELGAVIDEALSQSRYLIVICSPKAAQSRWVDAEIRRFKSLGREGQVLAVIVDGEPGASSPAKECFPPALRFRVAVDRGLTDQPVEPIAADLRPQGEGKAHARLKLIAGLIGLGFDELRQRDRQQRFWQRLQGVMLASALVAGLSGFWHWEQGRRAETARQAHLDQLVDLGRSQLIGQNYAAAAHYLAEALHAGRDTPALRLLLGRAMPSVDAAAGVRIHHPDGQISRAEWSQDGQSILTLWKSAQLWDARTGAHRAALDAHDYGDRPGVSLSADASRVLIEGRPEFSAEHTVVDLYSLPEGRKLASWQGHTSLGQHGPVYHSLDSVRRRALIIDPEGAVLMVGIDRGELLGRLPTTGARSAVFSPDGTRVLTANESGQIEHWDPASGRRLQAFDALPRLPSRAFFSPSGHRLLVTNARGMIKLHDPRSGQLLDALGGHITHLAWATFSRDGSRLATIARDGAKVWNLATSELLVSAECNCNQASAMDLSPDGRWLTTRFDSRQPAIWSVDQRRLMYTLDGHTSAPNSLRFSADGTRLLSAAVDGDVAIWNLDPLRPHPLSTLAHGPPIDPQQFAETYTSAFSPDGTLAASGGTDGTIRLWEAASGRLVRVLTGHQAMINHVAFSPDGRLLASASDDRSARLWDLASGRPLQVLADHSRFVRRVVFSPDGQSLLAVAGLSPKLWSVPDGQLQAELVGHQGPAIEGSFSEDGHRILTASVDGSARVWQRSDGRLLSTLSGHEGVVPVALFVDSGRRVVTAGVDGAVLLWDVDSAAQLPTETRFDPGPGGFRAGAISHNRERVLLAALSGELMLWDWASKGLLRMSGHSLPSYHAEFSRDDRLLVSASNDGSARLWDTVTGQVLWVLSTENRSGPVWSASISPDSTRLLTAGRSDPPTAELWDLSPETRDPETLRRLVRCKTPWRLEGQKLIPQQPDPERCIAPLALR